jgi:antitoxin YefM
MVSNLGRRSIASKSKGKFSSSNSVVPLRKMTYNMSVHLSGGFMAIQTTYTQARANLADLLDEVTLNQEVVIVNRRGKDDVAMVSAAELSSLIETAHLLRSPKNAQRLLTALQRARANKGARQSLERLRRDVGLNDG